MLSHKFPEWSICDRVEIEDYRLNEQCVDAEDYNISDESGIIWSIGSHQDLLLDLNAENYVLKNEFGGNPYIRLSKVQSSENNEINYKFLIFCNSEMRRFRVMEFTTGNSIFWFFNITFKYNIDNFFKRQKFTVL